MSKRKLTRFEKIYSLLDLKLQKDNPKMYDLCVLRVYVSEMNKGMRVVRKNKANSSGTKFVFSEFKNNDEFDEYNSLIISMIDDFKAKYDQTYCELYALREVIANERRCDD